jgi:fructose-bisphosphate aldolase, class I
MQGTDYSKELVETAHKIGAPGKGILAADESPGSVDKKFKPLGLENNEENRRRYRDMLLTSPGIEQYISGVIFHEETAKQSSTDGKNFTQLLLEKGIVPGIKVDKGLGVLSNGKEENFTKGLEQLPEMAAEFYKLGCRFAKWRSVLKIGNGSPTEEAIRENAVGLAKYASICQKNGLVPIVEPEILSDGPHSAEESQKITEKVLTAVFLELHNHGVFLEGCLLKPNMVTYGSEHPKKKENNLKVEAVRTVRALSRTVPPALVGITVHSWLSSSFPVVRLKKKLRCTST